MFKQIMKGIVTEMNYNAFACKDHDIERASNTAGSFSAYCKVLRMMGHDVDDGTYDDGGCSRIGYLRLNGELLIRNGEKQEALFKMVW